MIRVELSGPSNKTSLLDTPDPAMIGPWLMAIFKDFQPPKGAYSIPIEFRVVIYV